MIRSIPKQRSHLPLSLLTTLVLLFSSYSTFERSEAWGFGGYGPIKNKGKKIIRETDKLSCNFTFDRVLSIVTPGEKEKVYTLQGDASNHVTTYTPVQPFLILLLHEKARDEL
jgi:hypothetical protein